MHLSFTNIPVYNCIQVKIFSSSIEKGAQETT